MEALGIVLISLLGFYGLFLAVSDWLKSSAPRLDHSQFDLVLHVPDNGAESLEGIVRSLFVEGITKSLLDKKNLYILLSEDKPEINRLITSLQEFYPLEVLPWDGRYCKITDSKQV